MTITLSDLRNVGLTETESKIYFFLLERKTATQSEISSFLGVTKNRVSTVLGKLEDNKIIESRTVKKVKTYYPASFDNIKEFLAKVNKEEFEKSKEVFESKQGQLDNLVENLKTQYSKDAFVITRITSDEQLKKIRKEVFLSSGVDSIVIINNLNYLIQSKTEEIQKSKDRHDKKILTKGIFVVDKNKINQFLNLKEDGLLISTDILKSIESQIVVIGDHVYIRDLESRSKDALFIRNKSLANTLRSLILYTGQIKKTS